MFDKNSIYSKASWLIVFCAAVVVAVSALWFIQMGRSISLENRERINIQLQEFVGLAVAAIQPVINELQAGKLGRQKAIEDVGEILQSIRFDKVDTAHQHYIFAGYLHGGQVLAHPILDSYVSEDKNRAERESIFRKLAAVVQAGDGCGFTSYSMTDSKGDIGLKVAYACIVPELGIFVGSSVWQDEFRIVGKNYAVRAVVVAFVLLGLVTLPSFMALRELEKRNAVLAREVENRTTAEKALRRSEEQYRMAMASSSDGLLDWDMRGHNIFFSPRFFALLGMQPNSTKMDFESLAALMHPDDIEKFNQLRRNFLSGEITSHEGEYRLRHQDGGYRWFHATAGVFATNEDGQSVRVVGAFSDISEKKKNEIERQQLANQMRRAQKVEAVGTLAGGIAHEFNNLLTVILGFSQVSLRKAKQGTVPEKELGEVIDASGRARDLVKQLLTFSRQQSTGKTELDLRPLVKEAIRFMRSSLPSPVELELRISAEPLMVMANSGSIHQMLVNLINNGAQSMPDGGNLVVTVETTWGMPCCEAVTDWENGCVRLLVEDEGIGLPPDIADRIFDPFFTTRGVGSGSGLGLSVVDGIVREHGGAVWGRNKPEGKGAVFEVLLPMIKMPGIEQDHSAMQVISGQGNLILVEDDLEVLEVSAAMLEGLGYKVNSFDGAASALDAFQRNPGDYEILVTDYEMPVMNGLELIKQVQHIRPGLPALLISGGGGDALLEQAQHQGVCNVLVKPFSMSELSKAVREVVTCDMPSPDDPKGETGMPA